MSHAANHYYKGVRHTAAGSDFVLSAAKMQDDLYNRDDEFIFCSDPSYAVKGSAEPIDTYPTTKQDYVPEAYAAKKE